MTHWFVPVWRCDFCAGICDVHKPGSCFVTSSNYFPVWWWWWCCYCWWNVDLHLNIFKSVLKPLVTVGTADKPTASVLYTHLHAFQHAATHWEPPSKTTFSFPLSETLEHIKMWWSTSSIYQGRFMQSDNRCTLRNSFRSIWFAGSGKATLCSGC